MGWLETLRTSWDAIRSHRLRSGLTMLGILIGIAAVILTVGLGEGAQQQVSSAINALGTNLLVVTPGSTTTGGVRGGSGTASSLTASDATALGDKTVAPDIKAVAPSNSRSESLTAGSTNWTTSVVGTTPDWLSVRARTVSEGRFLSNQDISGEAANVVLGPSTSQQLFGFADPVGRTVTIGTIPFTVVGVLASEGTSSAQNQDDQAVVPISTASDRLFGGATRTSVQSIYVEATSADTLSAAYQEATQELLTLHHVAEPTAADFTIASQESLLTTATSVSKTLTILLGGVAALSLLVGGIGVMNIMLVSVTERIREIGLRKARRQPHPDPPAVPGGGERAWPGRRHTGGAAGDRGRAGAAGADLVDHHCVPDGHRAGHPDLDRHRHGLRRVPGQPGRPTGPDRRSP